jgi:radical SAM protein with 4Fe4S-binding SPASM domain
VVSLRQPEKIYGLDFTNQEIADAVDSGNLLSLDLETSLECNLRCIYCYSRAGKKRTHELEVKDILDVIDQAVDMGVKVISIIGGGEPLLYKGLFEIIEYISKKNVRRILFTNGTLVTDEIAARLSANNVFVVMKLNSMIPEVQDKLAGVSGTYDKIMKGIDCLARAGYPNEKHQLGVETIICKHNIVELPNIWAWARDRNIIPYIEKVTFMGRARDNDLNVTSMEVKTLFEKLLDLDEKKYNFTWKIHPPIAALSCNRHLYNCVVSSNGYVYPCVGVNISVGNVRYSKLSEIIKTSPVIQSLRHLKQNIKGYCKTCELAGDCYGCRGMAYHICGDFLESDPLCWNNPNRLI